MCVGSNEKQKNFDDKNIFILSYCIIEEAEKKIKKIISSSACFDDALKFSDIIS